MCDEWIIFPLPRYMPTWVMRGFFFSSVTGALREVKILIVFCTSHARIERKYRKIMREV